MNNVDKQYLDLLKDIIDNGVYKNTRSGEVLSVFGRTMRFNLQEGLPLLTTKKVFVKGIIHELLWFLRGDTNIKYLVDNNVHIWDDDSYRYFKTLDFKRLKREEADSITGYYKLDYCIFDFDEIECCYTIHTGDNEISVSLDDIRNITKEQFIEYVKQNAYIHRYDVYEGRNVSDYRVYKFGDMNDIYGKQWRNYGISGKDQITNIINLLKTNPDDRRLILNSWNPDVVDKVALPACHCFAQFYTRPLTNIERLDWLCEHTEDNKYDEWKTASTEFLNKMNIPQRALSCSFMMRSNDFCCGNPFNIVQYAILTYVLCELCNMVPDELIYNGGDVHVYLNQVELAKEQLKRKGYDKLPKLKFANKRNTIDEFKYEDFIIENYKCEAPIKYPLSVG